VPSGPQGKRRDAHGRGPLGLRPRGEVGELGEQELNG